MLFRKAEHVPPLRGSKKGKEAILFGGFHPRLFYLTPSGFQNTGFLQSRSDTHLARSRFISLATSFHLSLYIYQ